MWPKGHQSCCSAPASICSEASEHTSSPSKAMPFPAGLSTCQNHTGLWIEQIPCFFPHSNVIITGIRLQIQDLFCRMAAVRAKLFSEMPTKRKKHVSAPVTGRASERCSAPTDIICFPDCSFQYNSTDT